MNQSLDYGDGYTFRPCCTDPYCGLGDLLSTTESGAQVRVAVSVTQAEARATQARIQERERTLREAEEHPKDFLATLTPRERTIWSTGYRAAERDYLVTDIPLALSGDPAARARLERLVEAYNDEGTL